MPSIGDIEEVQSAIQAVMTEEKVDPRLYRLLAPGASLGGARPKALLEIDGAAWIVKFSEHGDDFCSPAVEHATMKLAKTAGIKASDTRLIEFERGKAVAVERFDRRGRHRLHVISAKTALSAAGQIESYPDMALLL